MYLALIRHAQTDGNVRREYLGRSDLPLNDDAKTQIVKNMKHNYYKNADIVFSSPMKRCIKTAQIIYPNNKLHIIKELCERDFGDFENLTHAQIINIKGFENWGMKEENMIFPNGESNMDFEKRCRIALKKVLDISFGVGVHNVCVITHGGVIMQFVKLLSEKKINIRDFQLECSQQIIIKLNNTLKLNKLTDY